MLEGLTGGERRVADLVGRGWTNREIADELRLRPKTIEWTLTKVFRKLELRSRTELALRVATSKPGVSLDAERNAEGQASVSETGGGVR